MMKYKVINFDVITSTNQYIKEQYKNLEPFTSITANKQTNGRGRVDRKWESIEGKNLTFSIYLKPKILPEKLPLLSLVIGASIYNVLSKYINCLIKWPNDIIVNDKKIAGILVESIYSNKLEALVAGIGININQGQFSNDLKNKATSLFIETNTEYNKNIILDEFIKEFDLLYNDFIIGNNQFVNICKEHNYLLNKEINYNGSIAKIVDISEEGKLIIDINGKQEQLFFGEITLESIYNK